VFIYFLSQLNQMPTEQSNEIKKQKRRHKEWYVYVLQFTFLFLMLSLHFTSEFLESITRKRKGNNNRK
jgi:hypothetical protein